MTRKETIEIKLKAGSLERSIKLINPYLTDGKKKRLHNHTLPMSEMKEGLSC